MRFLFLTLLAFSSQSLAQTRTYSSYSPSTVSGMSAREYTMGLSGNLSFLTTNGTQTTNFLIDTFFGWNRDSWEAGPKARIENRSTSGATVSFLAVGGYGDYNFKQGSDYNFGMTAGLLLGNASGAISTGGVTFTGSSQFNQIELGGVFKWFALRSASTAFRFELVYQSTSTNTSTTGLVVRYGLQTYF